MDDRDRIDEREQRHDDDEAPPDPRDRLDERVEQLGPPPPREPEAKVKRKRRPHPTDDLPPAA